jgi:hypothetical protein
MSKIDRHGDFTPSPHEQRVLGCGLEELVTRFGAENAIKRARSRKLHAFWSDVLVKIETQKHEQRKSEAPTKGVVYSHAG